MKIELDISQTGHLKVIFYVDFFNNPDHLYHVLFRQFSWDKIDVNEGLDHLYVKNFDRT